MTDNTELKRQAEAANAVTSDARVEMTIASEPGPNQAEIDAVTAFMGAATPAAIAALIAENERLRADCSSMRGSLKANAVSIKKLIKDGGRAARERDQLKAENEALRKSLVEVRECVQREYWDEYAGLDDTRAVLDEALAKGGAQ